MVDLDVAAPAPLEPNYRSHAGFEPVACAPFLDAAATPALHRALFVPWLTARHALYREYCLLRRKAQEV